MKKSKEVVSFKPETHVNTYFHKIKQSFSGKSFSSLFSQIEISHVSLNCWKKKGLQVIFHSDIGIVPHYRFYFPISGLLTCVKFTHHLKLILIYWGFLNCQASKLLKKPAHLNAGRLRVFPLTFSSVSLWIFTNVY